MEIQEKITEILILWCDALSKPVFILDYWKSEKMKQE